MSFVATLAAITIVHHIVQRRGKRMYEAIVDRVWELANLMAEGAKFHFYAAMAIADANMKVRAVRIDRVGAGSHGTASKLSLLVRVKGLELLAADPGGIWVTTPTDHLFGCKLMGGVRRFVEGCYYITAVSSDMGEHCDALFSLLFNYAMTNEVLFHHVGFRFPFRDSALSAAKDAAQKYGVPVFYRPASDHERWYVPVETGDVPNCIYWLEFQYFPDGPYTRAVHWDVVTDFNQALLVFLANPLKLVPEIQKIVGSNDVIGAVWQEDDGGVPIGIVARSRWWDVEGEDKGKG